MTPARLPIHGFETRDCPSSETVEALDLTGSGTSQTTDQALSHPAHSCSTHSRWREQTSANLRGGAVPELPREHAVLVAAVAVTDRLAARHPRVPAETQRVLLKATEIYSR